MPQLIYELFSGVGVYNQLFSLETAIYLANITDRKLILLIKYPLCHKGGANWKYGHLLNFFESSWKEFLVHGIEVYYGSDAIKWLSNNKTEMQNIKLPNRFSHIVFVDKKLDDDKNHKDRIQRFLCGRVKVVFEPESWTSEKVLLSQSNASRVFYNFYTTKENYETMSKIAKTLINFNSNVVEQFEKLGLPDKYIAAHFRFGDKRHSKASIDKQCDANYSSFTNSLKQLSSDLPLYVMSDRRDAEFLVNLEKEYTVRYTDELVKDIKGEEQMTEVFKFLVEKMICERADSFIGHEGSTVSNHIQYVRNVMNLSYNKYNTRVITERTGVYTWALNGLSGPNIGWRTYFSDNVIPINGHGSTKMITLTNDGYMHLTYNLLKSMEKLGIETYITVYCIGSKSYSFFKVKFPNNSVKQIDADDSLNSWIEYKSIQNKDIEGKKKWANITSYKFAAINQELRLGNNVIFVDGDIVFEKNPLPFMISYVSSHPDIELLIQNDNGDGSREEMCTGFFWMKANPNLINITNFETIQKNIDSFNNDQQYLRRYGRKINHHYLSLEGFPNGKFWRDLKPKEPFIIHFNYDVSGHKIRRMKIYEKWFIKENTPAELMQGFDMTLIKSDLDLFLEKKNITLRQGSLYHVNEGKLFFTSTIRNNCDIKSIKSVLEVGFLAGHMTEEILKLNSCLTVTNIDSFQLASVHAGKAYIDNTYPGRLNLLRGNSKDVLPTLVEDSQKFDLIVIDGSFDIDIVRSDMANAKLCSHENTIIYVNNVITEPLFMKYWTKSHSLVWEEYVNEGFIKQISQKNHQVGCGGAFGFFNHGMEISS